MEVIPNNENIFSEHITDRQRNNSKGDRGGIIQEAIPKRKINILESFYYCDEVVEKMIPSFDDFLLDSGAFTYMSGNGNNVDWNDYIKRYADFINRNNVAKFFELDIDGVIGFSETLKLRHRLEELTGKKCIPVWHKTRGFEQFKKDAKEYPYVAIGGIVSKEIKREEYKAFPTLIKEAHKQGAKVHGLGFTQLEGLSKYRFDSVDSTAWTTGNRFGFIYKFTGKTMAKIQVPKGHRIGKPREAAINNFIEWVKFSEYAENHL